MQVRTLRVFPEKNQLPTQMMTNISRQLTTGALALAGSVAAFGFGGIAQAVNLNANAGFGNAFGSSPGYTGTSLSTATSLTFSTASFASIPPTYTPPGGSSAPNDFFTGNGAAINSPTLTIAPNTLSLTSPGLPISGFLTFSTVAGAGSFDLESFVTETVPNDPNIIILKGLGTFNVPGFSASPGSVLFSFTQVGGTGAVSYSGTIASPPAFDPPNVPEPSTILGILAVAGAGALARRKS